MIPGIQELAERDVSWLAIRYPAVMRLLYRELAAPDGDAHAAGLELATRAIRASSRLAAIRDRLMFMVGERVGTFPLGASSARLVLTMMIELSAPPSLRDERTT